ncbi:hypothetical protein GCM10027562_24980 [Arthrobacter pigmenti]
MLLAWQPAEKTRKLLANDQLTAYTPGTPHTVDAVLDHLDGVRVAGYDVCESELDKNVWAVSAPVRSSTDEVVASITLAAPSQRMADDPARRKAIDIILAAAGEMSTDLGWVP